MFAAHASGASSAGAKASATGGKEEDSTDPDKDKGVDKKVGAERGLADKKAGETGTKGTGDAKDTPAAETSGGGVSVAAAVGVNIASSKAQAYIPAGGKVTSGGLLTLCYEQQHGCDGEGGRECDERDERGWVEPDERRRRDSDQRGERAEPGDDREWVHDQRQVADG